MLPEDCVPDGSGNPLAKRADFVDVACPRCAAPARRETDTMDTFVDSSWYYMRYTCPDAPTMVDAATTTGMPMDQYIGGITHAILHLLYARFWTKVMRDLGLVAMDEPFTRLLTQGMVLNHIYFRRTEKGGVDYFAPGDVEVTHDAAGHVTGTRLKSDGQPVQYDGVGTMSKSKFNGVDPQHIIDQYRRRRRAPVRDVRRPSRSDARMVERGGRRRAPVPAPPVDLRASAGGERRRRAGGVRLRPARQRRSRPRGANCISR